MADFFGRLAKGGKLSSLEMELRDLLKLAASVAQRLLPKDNSVSLQEWVDQRIPGEVTLGTDDAGFVVLLPSPDAPPPQARQPGGKAAAGGKGGKAGGTGASAGGKGASTGGKGASISPAAESWLSTLPLDTFAPEEETLRAAVTALVGGSSLPASQAALDAEVAAASRALLPPHVRLVDWIEARIGAEVMVFTDEAGRRMLKSATAPRTELREQFFAGLPNGSFTRQEGALRDALFDFLAGWKSRDLATLSHAGGDFGVKAARAFLPPEVRFKDWVERRIGGEIELTVDSKGQYVIKLLPGAQSAVAERARALAFPHAAAAPPEEVPGAERAAFLAGLPAHELLPDELELRKAVLDFLDSWEARNTGKQPGLSDAGQDKAIGQKRKAFLPPFVSLHQWMENRIGGEVISRRDERSEIIISRRGGGKKRKATTDAAAARPPVDEKDREARDEKRMEEKEAFFDALPADGFTPEEESLRDAILDFLAQWTSPGAPNLSQAGTNAAIRDARVALLGKGGVSLREWMDRRIGSEVETGVDEVNGKQTVFAMRGELEALIPEIPPVKRRRTEEEGGPPAAPKGAGKAARPKGAGKGKEGAGKGKAKPAMPSLPMRRPGAPAAKGGKGAPPRRAAGGAPPAIPSKRRAPSAAL